MSVNEYIDKLVSTGMEREKAQQKVNGIIAKITEKKGNVSDSEIEGLISAALNKITARKGERYKGICVGFVEKRDLNKSYGDDTLAYFNNEKTKSRVIVTEQNPDGYKDEKGNIYGVSINPDGVATPLDMREFLDVNKKFPNRGFKKGLKPRFQRTAYFLIEDKIVVARGNIDPIAGAEYYIYGKKNEYKGTTYLNIGSSGIQKTASITNSELWDAIYKFAEKSDFAIPLEDAGKIAPYDVKLINGYIKNMGISSNGKRWVVFENDECPKGQFGFAANDDADASLELTQVGNEVFALVQGMKPDPTRDSKAVRVLSVINNPASSANAELINDLEVYIEGD